MHDRNKALVRRYYDVLWNRWELAVADEILAPEIAFRGSLGVAVRGIDEFRAYMRRVREAFPDFENRIEDLLAEGDRVVARLAYAGTHLGPLFGRAPTGRRVAYSGTATFRVREGRIIEGRVDADTLGLLQQVGALPPHGAPPGRPGAPPRAIPYFHVDAFADRLFAGNPAGVCPLEAWLPEAEMQAIAAENRHSETAFLVREGDAWRVRWFTPACEVDLCGHATLAAAHVVLSFLAPPGADAVAFVSASGPLRVRRAEGGLLELDFPARPPGPCDAPPGLAAALGAEPRAVLAARAFLAAFDREADVRRLAPDFARLASVGRSVIVTAPGEGCDFVSRYFAPGAGVPEDPVTGSSHCTLVPYWAARLGRARLHARQLSARGGELSCELRGERVAIAGRAVLYLRGTIEV